MLQAQATTRASANRRLALVPDTDELGRTIDYVRDGTFAATLLLTIAAAAALRPALGISRRAFGLVALGEQIRRFRRLIGGRPARSVGGMATHLVDPQQEMEEEKWL